MGADLYWEDKRRREKGYSAGYEDGQKSIAKQIKELSQCQKKMRMIKEVYENDEPLKELRIKEIVYGDIDD